ncbi:MAG: PQQ-dependent sugar dehydrogenase [Planctomycetota bacterium]
MKPTSFLYSLLFSVSLIASGAGPANDKIDGAASKQDYATAALEDAGDVARGRRIFHQDTRAKCGTCHIAEGKGGRVGPDLSKIGGKFDRIHLVESILEPSKQIVEGYQTTKVLTTDGVVYAGIVRSESESTMRLEDSEGKSIELALDEIERREISSESLMPNDLQRQITVAEFTDLIAYLETLRLGQKDSFGAGTRGPIKLAEGFELQTIATGLDAAVAMEVLDDGRVLVCEQTGSLRVVENDVLLPEPMIHLAVEHYWERGLIGVTVHPEFPKQPWLYLCYVVDQPYSHHVISRFRVNGNVADPESEEVLLEGDDQLTFGGFKKAGHQGGAIHFGADGCLYIGLGEQTAKSPSQDFAALQGKILRIKDDGSIPQDNPFLDRTKGKYRSIWAVGCRNPFTFAIDSKGRMLINDVGGKFEEINPGVAGANYGWGRVEHGPADPNRFVGPIHFYPESSINGGDFAPHSLIQKTKNGDALAGRYFFADYVQGYVNSIDPGERPEARLETSQRETSLPAEPFVRGLRRPVDLRFAHDGSLYVLLRNSWVMDDKFVHHAGSLIKIKPSP